MAGVFPLPFFERGQALLARDFAALVGAVRALAGAGEVGLVQRRGGRCFRPFALAGACVPRVGEDGAPVAGVAEVLFQVGEYVTLCEDAAAGGLMEAQAAAKEAQVPCGVHGHVQWAQVGDGSAFSMRAVGMVCSAAAWLPPEVQEDGSYTDVGWHGGVVFSVVNVPPNGRGQVQCTPVPWVVPQCPMMVWRSCHGDSAGQAAMGELAVLPSPRGEEQLLTVSHGGYYGADDRFRVVWHEWRARLDRHGVLRFATGSRTVNSD